MDIAKQTLGSATGDALWLEIIEEARVFSAEEPVLASFFHTAILSHASLPEALAHNLAEILGNAAVSKLAIRQIFAEAMAADQQIENRMRRDLMAYRDRDPACDKYAMPLLYFKGFHALQIHRAAHYLWQQGRHALALHLQSQCAEAFAVDIHPGARIGGGIMIDHATGLVIGETTVVEDDVSMLHSVTLGGVGKHGGTRHPKIRSGVLISAGAKILGDIEVGEGAKIGAGSLVLENVPPHTTVAGVPARIVGRPLEAAPALEMNQHLSSPGPGQ